MNKLLSQKLKGRNGIIFHQSFIKSLNNPTAVVRESLELVERVLASGQKIVYISGSLTHVPQEEKNNYLKTKEIVDKFGAFGYVPHLYSDPIKHPNEVPREVRDIDFLWSAVVADTAVFWGNYPSIGVGAEMAWAEIYGVPSIKLVANDKKMSRIGYGLYDNAQIIRYDKVEVGLKDLKKALKKLLETL